MTTFLIQHFETLKKQVLNVAELKNISPSDCRTISDLIFRKTNQQVSETTLKRIYGFAYSKFKPSLFTIDAMARYCGFEGWTDYCDSCGNNMPARTQSNYMGWDGIKQNAYKTTTFTLQAIKNRSGIPYSQTIKRKFIDDHFDAFLKDDYAVTIIAGPAGYGKTIALSHWIEEKMAINTISDSDDIILFFSSNVLTNVFVSGKNINDWLLSLFGYGIGEDFSSLLESKHNGIFYLIIDGLDEHMFKGDQFQMLLNQLMEILSFYKSHKNFKMVLTMRSATWINNQYELDEFKSKCFLGFKNGDNVLTNVPLFSNQEINELSKNINPDSKINTDFEVLKNFSYPLYLQYYYKQHKLNFSFNNVTPLSVYELVSTFILNKIYLGPHSVEKSAIVKMMLENMDFSNGLFEVNKFKVNDYIKQNHHAYNELLGIGFLRELNKSGDMHYKAIIEFGNNDFLNYGITRHLLYHNNNIIDGNIIAKLNSLFKNDRKIAVIKWMILYAAKNGQTNVCEYLSELTLTSKEKSEIIIFLGSVIENEYASLTRAEALNEYFQSDCSDALFNYFFGLEFVNTDYKKALRVLLVFNLSTKKRILIYSALAIIAVMQLDFNTVEEQLLNLKRFSQDELQQLAINPLSCIETIYYFFKYGIVKKEALAELTKFYFNPPKTGERLPTYRENDILYLLGVYTLSICKNPVKLIRFTNTLNNVYTRQGTDADAYNFILKTKIAEAHLQAGKEKEATTMYNQIIAGYSAENYKYTPFMLATFYLLKINMSLNDTTKVAGSMRSLMYLTDEADFKLVKTEAFVSILKSKYLHEADSVFYKRCYFDFIKTIRESDLRENSFIESETILAIK